MKRCSKCVLPETHEAIHFDGNGTCSVCAQQTVKQEIIDWGSKKKELDDIIQHHRGKSRYDCIVPFSGGKDSTWTLYYLIKEYKLKPLVVRFDHGFLRSTVQKNTIKTLRSLGCDFHHFTPNWNVVRKLMLQSFLEKGDFCWHCHTGIYAYPMHVAIQHQVPLVIWGEPSAEYTSYYKYDEPEEVDEKRFNRFINLGITADDMFVRLEGMVEERDLAPFKYPPHKELKKLNYRSICLGSYIAWDVKKQSRIIQDELHWEGDEVEGVPPGYKYEKIECYMQGVRDFIKYLKRGYTRPSHLMSIDIRNGRMTRADALRIISEYEGRRPHSLSLFLAFVGLKEEEFMEIALSHAVSPWACDVNGLKAGAPPHDSDEWCHAGGMPRSEAELQLKRWQMRKEASLR